MKHQPTIAEGLLDMLDEQEIELEAVPAPDQCYSMAVDALQKAGIPVRREWTAANAVMVAEACNLAAKIIDEDFYGLKPGCVEFAIELGAEGGWGNDDCFHVGTPETGVACFHDPYGQITIGGRWPHQWSGIRRQHAAFAILRSPTVRRLYAEATMPGGQIYGASDSAVCRALRKLAASG